MAQVRDGNVALLGDLFERHSDKLYGFFIRYTGRRTLSEDLVQDVFLRILKYRHTFRGESGFTVWMYQLARNAANDHFRKWKKEYPVEEIPEEHHQLAANSDDLMHRKEESILLQTALGRLDPEKREVLVLSRFQDMKYEQIGEILNCPVGTVKARVHYALKDLREEYFKLTGERTTK